jgi:hypothetical protein
MNHQYISSAEGHRDSFLAPMSPHILQRGGGGVKQPIFHLHIKHLKEVSKNRLFNHWENF